MMTKPPFQAQQEKRKQPRISVPGRPEFPLILKDPDGGYHEVQMVRDISSAGISLELDFALMEGTPLSLRYEDPQLTLEVTGVVVWCTLSKERTPGNAPIGSHNIGIHLYSPVLFSTFVQPGFRGA
jgi:hypothetical protein